MAMPSPVLGIAVVPAALIPIKFPCTVAPPDTMSIPFPEFPEITLRAAADVPPIVTPITFPLIPPPPFPNAAVPAALVPMKFPATSNPENESTLIP